MLHFTLSVLYYSYMVKCEYSLKLLYGFIKNLITHYIQKNLHNCKIRPYENVNYSTNFQGFNEKHSTL